MDINYILQREQIERVRAERAASAAARDAHVSMADAYLALVISHRDRVAGAFLSGSLVSLALNLGTA